MYDEQLDGNTTMQDAGLESESENIIYDVSEDANNNENESSNNNPVRRSKFKKLCYIIAWAILICGLFATFITATDDHNARLYGDGFNLMVGVVGTIASIISSVTFFAIGEALSFLEDIYDTLFD